ncbi:MAG: acyl-CoA desaturase [Bacteroidota bacterium]
MKIEKLDIVRFAPRGNDSFIEAVTTKVNKYFEDNKISPYANTGMWVKTAFMISLYIIPYLVMVTGLAAGNVWIYLGMWFLMGWGMVGIGTSVMHDANHGTYSASKKVNKFIGHILEVIGGFTATWKIQHNVLHHTYTNIAGLDEDIESIFLLRLSPNQPVRWFHKYQYLYAWFFYMNMTIYWMTVKDYLAAIRYGKHDLLKKEKLTLRQAISRITIFKVIYYAYVMALPMFISGQPWYMILVGFCVMHFTVGMVLSCVFQPAHVMEDSAYLAPVVSNGTKRMEDTWAIHELANTSNFAPNNHLLSWFIGGLNFQIEHHLFSDVCHVHFKKLAPIVKSVALEYGIPYNSQPSFFGALWLHFKMLKKLGEV